MYMDQKYYRPSPLEKRLRIASQNILGIPILDGFKNQKLKFISKNMSEITHYPLSGLRSAFWIDTFMANVHIYIL